MKKTACTLVASILLACGLLTGCVSNDPFESSMVTNYASVYGVQSLGSSANVNTAIISFTNKNEPSAYYSTQDKAEAQALYNRYVNKNNYYPAATNINAATVVAVKDVIVTLHYDSNCSVLYFEEKSDAKAYFDACKPIVEKDREFKTGIKNDYEYAIAYQQTANRAGNCDYLIGVYLRGNSVILINGFSPQGQPDSFCDYIFNKIGVIDPNTLKKK